MPQDRRKRLTRPAPVKLDAAKLAALDEQMQDVGPARGGCRKEPTPEQAEILRRYWSSGKSRDGICRVLGVAENTARRWAREAGL